MPFVRKKNEPKWLRIRDWGRKEININLMIDSYFVEDKSSASLLSKDTCEKAVNWLEHFIPDDYVIEEK